MQSEQVILEAPFSFVGSTKRIWRLSDNVWVQILVLVPLLIMAWSFIVCWYMAFGLLVVPWRLFRRGQRKNKQQQLQHRELLEQLKRS